jgi:hypothetical protein
MGWLRRNPLLGVLAAASILLAIVIGFEAGFGASLRDALRPAGAKPALPTDAKLLPPLVATAVEQAYPETTTRPLFTPTRRPAPEIAAAPPQPTIVKGQFVLAGVIAVGDNRVAMLREKSNNRIHRVERGKEVNGMKVADIQPEQVTLAVGTEQEVINLSVIRPAPGTSLGSAVVQGPFAGIPANPGASPAPAPGPMGQPGPLPAPGGFPAQPGGASMVNPANQAPATTSGANPASRAIPEAGSTPMTPEELLARRRARRLQQNQTQ